MSQTERLDEPTDTFDFYLKFAKPLVLNLKDPNDRVIASAWVQKLKDASIGSESVRKDYLKLLLFVLHRSRLIGPFLENPAAYTDLKNFPVDFKILDVAKDLILSDELERKKRIKSGLASGDYPPYSVECSADLLEYAAAQDIPKFGVHAYYAISLEPIPKWDNTEKGVLPKAAIEVLEKSIRQVSSTSELEKGAQGETSAKSTKKSPFKAMSRGGATPKLSPKSPKSAEELPSPFQGTPKRSVGESPFGLSAAIDDRPRVTWGSNLIDVTEPVTDRDESVTSMGIMEDNIDDFLVEGVGSGVFGEMSGSGSPAGSTPRSLQQSSMYGASLPYQTPPPRGGYPPSPAPSLPYRTPPRMDFDMTAGSAPYMTPPRRMDFDMTAGSAPYMTPPRRLDFDMTGGSLPYLTPPRGAPSPAPSLPYRTPPPRDSSREPIDVEIEPLTADAREIIEEAHQSMNMAGMDEVATTSGQSMEQMFPHMQEADPWSQMFFDAQADDLIDDEEEISLSDDMEVTATPVETVDDRMRQLMLELADRKSASPVAGGVAATTPRSSPSPARTKMYGQDFPLFTELLPAYESPVRSPMSAVQEAADEQYASLRDRSPSPRQQRQASPRAPTPRQPSPVRDPYTDSFGLPIVHTHDSPLKERSPSPSSPKARSPPAAQQSPVAGPSTAARSPAAGASPAARSPAAGSPKSKSPAAGPPSPAKSPKTEADIKELAENQYKTLMESPKPEKPAPLSQEEVEAFEDSQYATLYESLIAEPEAPGTPGGRSPRHAHPADLMGVEAPVHYQSPQQPHFFDGEIPGNLPSPIGAHHQLGGWQTPPNMRLQPRRTASPILPPMVAYFGQDLLGQEQFPADEEPPRSPEPPPPSPPTPPARFAYEEMADPFQLDADFNEQVDDIMDEEMAALGGMVAAHEIHPFQPGRREISRRRGTPMPRQEPIDEEPEYLMLPSPERASPHRSFSEYDYLLSPDQTQPQQPQQQQQQQQQSPGQVAGPSMRSQAEELFIQNFDNPDHQAMMRRVMALVEDVENEALITEEDVEILKAAHPLSAIESTDAAGMMAVSPPREQRELLELNDMEGPMSPLQQDMEIPEFNYQQSDFMAPVPQYQLPYELPQSRHVFTEPGEMEEPEQPFQEILAFEEAQGQPPMQIQDMAVAPSPSPIRRRIPTPGTYVSPPGNMVDFFMENLNRQPAPYREGPTTVFTGGRQQMVHRDASRRVPRMRRIRELPNMDEEGVNFMEHVERASQWYGKGSTQAGVMPIDVTRNRERMQQRRASRNVLSNTNLRTVTETQEVSEPLVSPLQPRGQARIKKRTVRKRINFDQDNPSGSPEPQKQVSPIHEPLPLLPDRPLPPPRAPPPQMSTSPRAGPSGAPPPSRRVLFGTPPRPEGDRPKPRRITLFGSPLPEGEEASPTTASSMLTMMRHADLLRQPSPQQGDDMMGAYGAVQEASARHILDDDDIPQQLPSPMRAPIEIPGWQTPSPAPRAASPRLPPAAGPCGQANLMIEQPPLLDDDGMLMSPTQSPMLATQRQSFMPSPGRAQAPWPGGMRTVTSTTTTKTPEMTKTTKTTRTTPSSPQPPPQFSPSPQQQQQMMARQMSPAMEQQQQPSPQSYQMAPPMTPRTPAHVSPRPSPYWTGGTPMQTPPFQMIQQQQTQQRAMSSPASPGAWARTINDMSTLQDDFDIGMSPHLVESPQQRPPEEEWADIMALPRDEAQVQARYGHLTTADDYVMPEARRRTPRQGTLLERVEQLVADVPSPEMQYSNQASPVNTVQYSPYQSPHWTPTLPQARTAAAATGFDGLSPMRPQAAGITNLEVISPVLAMSPRSPTASPSPRQSPCPQSPCGMSPVFATSPQTLGVVPFLGEEAEPYDLPSSPQMSPPPRAIQEDIQYSPPAFQSPPRSRTPSPRVPTPRAPTPRMPTPPMAQSPCRPATPGSPPMTMTAASPRRSPVVGNLVAMSPQQQNQPYMVETTETVEEYGPENIMDQFMTNAEMMQQPSALTERQLDWQSPPPPARVAPASPYRPELHLPAARRTLDMMAAVPNDMMFMNESLEDPLQSPRTPTQGIFEQAGADGGGPGLFDYDYPDMYDDPLSPMYQDGSGCGGGACPSSSSSQYYDQGMDMNEDEQMLQQRMSPMAGPSHQPHSVTPGASETTMNEEIVYGASGQPHTITKETTTVSPDGQVQEEYEYTEMMDDGQGQNQQQQQGDDDGYGYAD